MNNSHILNSYWEELTQNPDFKNPYEIYFPCPNEDNKKRVLFYLDSILSFWDSRVNKVYKRGYRDIRKNFINELLPLFTEEDLVFLVGIDLSNYFEEDILLLNFSTEMSNEIYRIYVYPRFDDFYLTRIKLHRDGTYKEIAFRKSYTIFKELLEDYRCAIKNNK